MLTGAGEDVRMVHSGHEHNVKVGLYLATDWAPVQQNK